MPADSSRPPRPAPQRGEVLAGRYRLDGPLGSGGTAEVLRGTDLRLRRQVAVKRFRPGTSTLSEEEFGEEAVLLAGLRHPGLVTVYDAGEDDHGAYLVMELIDGITLRERIAAGPLPYDQVVRLGSRLASALAHVHAAGIVHRDVKPSNVLLNADGEPFLADFGLSHPSDDPTRAEPGTVVGTAAYMAPEQVLGKGYGPASDVYALGLVLLECLKGEKEYLGSPTEAGVARLLRPPETTVGVPEALVPVVEAMTHPDPQTRPDAARCALLLQAAAEGTTPHPTVGALPPTRSGSADGAPRERRRRLLAVSLAAVGLGAVGAALVVTAHGDQPTPDAVNGGRSPTKSSAAPATPGRQLTPTRAPAWPAIPARTTAAVTLASPAQDTADQPGNGHGNGQNKGKSKSHGKPGKPAK